MPETGFHFSAPLWLLLIPIPAIVWFWLRLTRPRENLSRYAAYADQHLLPDLLGLRTPSMALAGPRWDYKDLQLFRPGSDVVILLDLSKSMDVADVAGSRLHRARQEIEDLVTANQHSRIGLIGFASTAHVIAPLTQDGSTLRRQLPALSTELVQLKGSRLQTALTRAKQMLVDQPEDSSRHLILITDGDFEDTSYLATAQELADHGIRMHVLGVGTTDGGPVPGGGGTHLRHPRYGDITSKLDDEALTALSKLGDGIYRRATFSDKDTEELLQHVRADSRSAIAAEEKTRVWNEQFYWLVLLASLIILPRFRRMRNREERK